jgi:Protein of unknown function (DUF2911)
MEKLLLCLFSATQLAFGQVNFPDPSPLQTIRQNFGMSAIELTYSRPGVKGRKIIGFNEPYDSVWRTGANAPTKIRFFSPVEIGGNKIDTGTYVLYTIPTAKDWTVIINRGVKNWGSDQYKNSDDICRFVVTPERKHQLVETLTFQFENVKGETCDLTLQWEDWKINIPIVALLRDPLRQQIEANLKTDKPMYWLAAQFYFEYEHNNAKALEMINSAIAVNENAGRKPYWQYFYKARILKDLGRKQEAIDMATLTAVHAKAHGNRTNYVQQSEDLIKSLK